MLIVKKYTNRRLYDTGQSRYITLEELGERIRDGHDVQVLDARSGEDLTRATLTQLVIEGRGAARWFSVALLTQLVRMQDELLADFFGRFLGVALELYLAARRGAQALPLGALPFAAADPIARLLAGAALVPALGGPSVGASRSTGIAASDPGGGATGPSADIAELRRELADIRRQLDRRKRRSGS